MLDSEGHPVGGAAVKLVADADTLMLSSDGEALNDSLEELTPEPGGVEIELGLFGNDTDGPEVNVKELKPDTPEDGVNSALRIPEIRDELALGDKELDETRGPVERGGIGRLEDISLRIKSGYYSSTLGFVLIADLEFSETGLEANDDPAVGLIVGALAASVRPLGALVRRSCIIAFPWGLDQMQCMDHSPRIRIWSRRWR